jgi:hypothetical protein
MRGSRRSFRRQLSIGLAAIAVMAAMLSSPSPASASAFGCEYIGGFGFSFEGISLRAPQGWLCHDIDGDGKVIRNEAAHYGPFLSLYGLLTARICNWRIDFVYRRAYDGSVYRTDRGATHYACGYFVSRNVSADKTLAHYGTACAQLYVNGVLRAKQCHNITA